MMFATLVLASFLFMTLLAIGVWQLGQHIWETTDSKSEFNNW